MELRDYLRVARQRWMTIVIVTLVAVGLGTLLTLRATPEYASTARLFISTPQSDSNAAYQGGLFSQARVKSYADLLTGEEISRRVVDRLNLHESPQDLSDQISAVAKLDTVVLAITVTDPQPAKAQLLSQTVAEEFVKYVKELETPDGQTTAPVKASIVDRATKPGGPVSPQPTRNLALATILGLLIGAGVAILKDSFDTTIKSSESLDLASGGVPLLGSIHFDKEAPKHPLITSLSSHAPRTESFRVLRTSLQFINVDSDSKVYVVTSAIPGEGKSTTTVNLAITLAEAGEKVALLEGDLRRPKAISYMKLEGAVGVTTVLVGRIDLDDAMQNWAPGLDVLAAGSTPPNPAELLQSNGMKRLVATLRGEYDIVLIDAPPLLPVADAAVLAAGSDGAILVVHHGKTTKDQVRAAVGRLESVDARIIGTVINMSPAPKRGHSSYGYGYGYGYAPEAGRSKADLKAEFKIQRKDKKPAVTEGPTEAETPPAVEDTVAFDGASSVPESFPPDSYLDDIVEPVDPTFANKHTHR
ncbi:MAG: polysaccharide biosynthesis tyrosine autokinase [Aeromicrobium sp.]